MQMEYVMFLPFFNPKMHAMVFCTLFKSLDHLKLFVAHACTEKTATTKIALSHLGAL